MLANLAGPPRALRESGLRMPYGQMYGHSAILEGTPRPASTFCSGWLGGAGPVLVRC